MARTHEQTMAAFIRGRCRDLETTFDQEAVQLICGVGVFAAGDPSKIDDAVDRLTPSTASTTRALNAIDARLATEELRTLRRALEDVYIKQLIDRVESAFLLGIAVGRRLGSHALTVSSPAASRDRILADPPKRRRRVAGAAKAAA